MLTCSLPVPLKRLLPERLFRRVVQPGCEASNPRTRDALHSGYEVGHGDLSLVDLVTQIGSKLQNRAPRHAVQKSTVEWLRDYFIITDQQEVRSTCLLDIAVRSEQHLIGAVFFLRVERWT